VWQDHSNLVVVDGGYALKLGTDRSNSPHHHRIHTVFTSVGTSFLIGMLDSTNQVRQVTIKTGLPKLSILIPERVD
jgi:hypothetical protein